MPLSAGDKLGPYEILAAIGKGGMGEVFRARDPRTGRDVAIKISAEHFSERFDREVRAIASLNHPNICSLYDVGPNYLVMELVEGENLKGPLPLATALDYARRIADALEAAHEKGIVHRDLKPGNIRVKADGTLKVLDFGLAKMGGTPTASSDESPTVTMNETQAGVILGTAAYMSPEQAKGKPVDKRADIWAFGVVLYEMLTGERLFHGETITEVLASVLKEEPKFDRVPEKVRPLLRRCLEKDPKKRLRDIGEAMAWVEVGPVVSTPAAPARSRFGWAPWAVAGAAVVALGAVLWMQWPRVTDRPLVRQDVDLGAEIFLPGPVQYVTNVVISPDGTRVAFVARTSADGPLKLFTRRLDQPKAMELPGTEDVVGPFFSPDGQWLGFASGAKLNKIAADGGAVVPLADLSATFAGASWSEDSIVVGQSAAGGGLKRLPAAGGQLSPVTEMLPGETIHSSPQILPGGKAVLFAANTTGDPDQATVEVVSLADHRRKTLVHGGAFPRYAASSNTGSNRSGHLLYTFQGTLMAIPFDADRLETHGTAVPVLNDVRGVAQNVAGKFDVSQTGTLVYQKGSGGALPLTTIQSLDSSGKLEPLLARQGTYLNPRLSPDGKRLALVVREGGNQSIQVYEWQSDRTTKLTGAGFAYNPVWSPDGRYVIFRFYNGGAGYGVLWTRADGASQPQPLLPSIIAPRIPWSFSPDGKRLAYFEPGGAGSRGNNFPIWTVPVEEQNGQLKAGTPEQFLKDQVVGQDPTFSPDGKWLAYSSADSGTTRDVFVRPFQQPASGPGGKWVISTQDGRLPVWSRASPDLLYQGPGGQMMAVRYTVKGDVFVADKPRGWGPTPVAASNVMSFDLAPDGKRLAVVTPVGSPEAPKQEHEVVFLQNFFDELRRKVPLGE
jgi:Tol biopolymer transport system component/predicted Ser/Thr protein kinase